MTAVGAAVIGNVFAASSESDPGQVVFSSLRPGTGS
jgi:hypothetical protein